MTPVDPLVPEPLPSSPPRRAPSFRRLQRLSQRGRNAVAAVLLGALGGIVGLVAIPITACGPPPIGWQGAGRSQTLPTPEPDSGIAESTDSGTTSDVVSAEPDSGGGSDDTGAPPPPSKDAGKDSGHPADTGTAHDAPAAPDDAPAAG
jgi:hypothetical protein